MHISLAHQSCRAGMLALLIAGAPAALRAQRISDETVRITSSRSTYEGTLMSLDSATLVMHSNRGDTLRFPTGNIASARVLRGHHRAGAARVGKGALIGLGIGTVLGVYALQDKGGRHEASELKGIAAMTSIVGGTVVGTVVGGVMAFQKVDNWVSFDPRDPAALRTTTVP